MKYNNYSADKLQTQETIPKHTNNHNKEEEPSPSPSLSLLRWNFIKMGSEVTLPPYPSPRPHPHPHLPFGSGSSSRAEDSFLISSQEIRSPGQWVGPAALVLSPPCRLRTLESQPDKHLPAPLAPRTPQARPGFKTGSAFSLNPRVTQRE